MTSKTPTTPIARRTESAFVDVEAWTDKTLDALNGLTLTPSPRAIRGTTVELSIPLDAPVPVLRGTAGINEVDGGVPLANTYPPLRRKTSQRDSLKRRDEFLKGKEGSRRRQKWENDRLVGNPYAQPPLPHDWEVRPTHLVKTVPYYLASLWDAKRAEEERLSKARKNSVSKRKSVDVAKVEGLGRVPKSLKETMKRSRAAKTLLQELEEQVRQFVETWNEASLENKVPVGEPEPEEDDFVVVDDEDYLLHSGMIANPEKLVFDSPEQDQTAKFNRYLVHALGAYYGLDTWSVTVEGNPPRREAYVGVREKGHKRRSSRDNSPPILQMPRPMWARV